MIKPLTLNEQNILMEKLENEKELKNFYILLALQTGIRLGEVCSLKWNNIDIERGVITISTTALYVREKGKYILKEDLPKTTGSIREIYMPKRLCEMLKMYKTKNFKGEDSYLFSKKGEMPANPYLLRQKFKTQLRKLNITQRGFHILRHTFCTRALEKGVDIKVLSELLGHTNIMTTLNSYAHILTPHKIMAMEMIGSVFGRYDISKLYNFT